MLAWTLTAENAVLFLELCEELGAKTEEQRVHVLLEMAKFGKVKNLTKTEMTKSDYMKHLNKHFNIAELKNDGSIAPYSDDQKENNSNG